MRRLLPTSHPVAPKASELSPDDVLTMRLSNGMSATLTSSMLKEKAGQGEFPVKARMTKIGTIYLLRVP